MKKTLVKKLLAVTLTIAMGVSLAACGDTSGTADTTSDAGQTVRKPGLI